MLKVSKALFIGLSSTRTTAMSTFILPRSTCYCCWDNINNRKLQSVRLFSTDTAGEKSPVAKASIEQLSATEEFVMKHLPDFFKNPSLLLPKLRSDVMFDNEVLYWKTNDLGQHLFQLSLMKLLLSLRYATVFLKPVDSRKYEYTGVLKVWFRLLHMGHLRSFGFNRHVGSHVDRMFNFRHCQSTFWVDDKGKIYKHKLITSENVEKYSELTEDQTDKTKWPFDT